MAPPDDPTGAPAPDSLPEITHAGASRPTVVLPAQRRPTAAGTPSRRRAPVVVAATVNALWAALTSVLPVTVTVTTVTLLGPSRPPVTAAIRYSLATWLLAHGVPLVVARAPVALVPLALTALAGWRLIRAGRNTARAIGSRRVRSLRPVVLVAISVGVAYGLLGAGAAVLAHGLGLSVAPGRAGLTVGAFGFLAAFAGAGAESGALTLRWMRLPAVARDGTRTGVVATLLVLASGAIAAGVAVAVAGGSATAMLRNYHAGVAGQAGVILVCVVYAPNIATWATAYLAGPGFTLAGVPELPVFAGLPTRPVTGGGQLLLVVPVLAGCIAGVLMARRARRVVGWNGARTGWRTTAGVTILSGVVSGALLGMAGYLAAGGLGTGLLAHTGQVGWQFAAVAGLGIAFGTAVGVIVTPTRT